MISKRSTFGLIIFVLIGFIANGQQAAVAEDSLNKAVSFLQKTYIGGYGDASYQRDFNLQTSQVNLNRLVIFIGHRFNTKISLFTELEVEDAKIGGGSPDGEFAIEQAYLRFSLNKNIFLNAGLFIPRIGMINENHLPSEFNGVERPIVEKFVIPSTWRELGVGLYGQFNRIPLNFSFAVCNGLNAAQFEHGTGIREGRFEGKNASANNLAITGSAQYRIGSFRLQASGYVGGSVGLSPRQADSLKLKSGMFGTPVILGEINARYERGGLALKALATIINIPDASDLNNAYASNTPNEIYGFYGEASYNILGLIPRCQQYKLWMFVRYEKIDLNSRIPGNGIKDETLKQDHIIAGFTYQPINNIVVKADVRFLNTGRENEALVFNPGPVDPVYQRTNTFLNIGLGYAF